MSIDDGLATEFFRTYDDRGLLKYLGFYLSDHTAAPSEDLGARRKAIEVKPQSEEIEINEIIELAYLKDLYVSVQMSERNEANQFQEDVIGKIIGSDDLNIFIGKPPIPSGQIRHIEIFKG
ncbi:hypothetical protein [Enterococcus sp. HY326]|uniref:hypothetical protein n=1 Tax=Enterococcus sp. HY326 TaxID=2971265 RepID=UPI002240737A|nr:hypothetical protein [Enterococcus sp. HY326]